MRDRQAAESPEQREARLQQMSITQRQQLYIETVEERDYNVPVKGKHNHMPVDSERHKPSHNLQFK